MPHRPRRRPVRKANKGGVGKGIALAKRNPRAAGRGLQGLKRPPKR